MQIELDDLVHHYLKRADDQLEIIVSVEYSKDAPSRDMWVMEHVAKTRGLIAAVRVNLIESEVTDKEDLPF